MANAFGVIAPISGNTSYSHCPRCGQQTIAGQFICGHAPPDASAQGFDPWEHDFVHSEQAKPFICKMAVALGLKLQSVHDHVRKDDDSLRCMYAQYAVRLLASQAAGAARAWIPVTERLPEGGVEVLATFKGQFGWVIFTARMTKNDGLVNPNYAKPTHWQELPAPPEAERSAK